MKFLPLALTALIFTAAHFARAAELDESLKITLTSEKLVYSLNEEMSFKVTTKNVSSGPIAVLIRGFDWKDLERLDAAYQNRQQKEKEKPDNPNLYPNIADQIRGRGDPRPLGKLEFTQIGGAESSVRVSLDSDIGGCGTGLEKGLMPAGVETETVYKILPEHMAAKPGVYHFQWRAYRPQGRDRSRVDLSSATSNIIEIRIEK